MFRRLESFLLLACLTMPFWGIAHPVWEVDDARYAEIPREMLASGDWATPSLNFMAYVEKPPLPYWMTEASYALFGVREWSAHLVPALLALLCLLAVFRLGSLQFGGKVGLYAAVILATCPQFFLLSRMLTPDLPLTAFLLLAQLFLLRGLAAPGSTGALALAGAFCGLAFLCKGLPGIFFPLLWTGTLFLLPGAREKLAFPGRRALLAAAGSFMAVAAPWYLLMETRHPGFLRFFFWEQNVLRFFTPVFQREQPWFFFLAVDAAGMLPWTPMAFAALIAALLASAKAGNKSDAARGLALWALSIILLFSMSRSKLATYILPALPQQAVLAAWFLRRIAGREGIGRRAAWAGLAFGAVIATVGAAAIPIAANDLESLPAVGRLVPAAWTLLAAIAVSQVAASALLLARGASGSARRAAFLALGLGAILANGAILFSTGLLADHLSAKKMAQAVAARARPGDEVIAYGVYLHGLPFYTGLPVKLVNWYGELYYAFRTGRYRDRFGDDETIRTLLVEGDKTVFIALRKKEAVYFLQTLPAKRLKVTMAPYGNWILATVRGRPSRPGPRLAADIIPASRALSGASALGRESPKRYLPNPHHSTVPVLP